MQRSEFGGHGYVWLMAWFTLNIAVTLFNKVDNLASIHSILKYLLISGFGFPIMLSALHMAWCTLCSWVLVIWQQRQLKSFTGKQWVSLFLFSMVFCLNITVGNAAMKFSSIAFVQILRYVAIRGFVLRV